jgi:hypothetical protein
LRGERFVVRVGRSESPKNGFGFWGKAISGVPPIPSQAICALQVAENRHTSEMGLVCHFLNATVAWPHSG